MDQGPDPIASVPLNTKLGSEVHDDDIGAIKAKVLREAAREFHRAAAAGEDPEANRLAAHLLEKRAARVEAGEDDHSALRPEDISSRSGLEPDQSPSSADGD